MSNGRLISIGECMIEMSGGENDQYRLGVAGDTLNTAYYANALLPDGWTTEYFTALGTDIYSDRIISFLETAGIGTQHIKRLENKRPGLYIIHQADGDRHFTYWRDTSAAKLLADDEAALRTALSGADIIYLSGITLAILAPTARARLLSLVGEYRSAGAQVAFDPNIRPALWPDADVLRDVVMAAATVCDIVLPTHGDEVPYFGDADAKATGERYLNAGAKEVVIKSGGDAALVMADGEVHEVAPAKAVAVDATGAGDSFAGGYIAARAKGLAPAEAAAKAHGVAGQVIQHRGALIDPGLVSI